MYRGSKDGLDRRRGKSSVSNPGSRMRDHSYQRYDRGLSQRGEIIEATVVTSESPRSIARSTTSSRSRSEIEQSIQASRPSGKYTLISISRGIPRE